MFRAHSKPTASHIAPPTRRVIEERRGGAPGARLNGPIMRGALLVGVVATGALGLVGCDSGLVPPEQGMDGAIAGTIEYVGPWPPQEAVVDLRFVALRFIPEDTTDFLQLNRMEVSPTLRYGVPTDTFFVAGVAPGVFPFSGVARQATQDIFSWRPVGLYEDQDGVVEVSAGQTVTLRLVVDFNNPPDFP